MYDDRNGGYNVNYYKIIHYIQYRDILHFRHNKVLKNELACRVGDDCHWLNYSFQSNDQRDAQWQRVLRRGH